MHEVITRRFRRYLAEKEKTGEWADGDVLTEEDGRPKRFAYPPQLVVVDGGQPQVAAAKKALDGLASTTSRVRLAKRLEEVWCRARRPVVLPRSSEGLYLLHASATRPTVSRSPTSARSGPSGSGQVPWTRYRAR